MGPGGEVSQISAASSPRSACWLPHCPWRSSPETAIRPPLGCCCFSAVRPEAPLFLVESTRPAARRCPLILLLCSRLCAVMSSGDRAARCVRGGGLDAFCLLGFPVLALHSRGALKRQNRALHHLDLHEKKLHQMSENVSYKADRAITGYFNVFLAMCFHSWGCMNGASWMEAARQHKRAENSDYTQPLERLPVRRLIVLFLRAGEHRGPESILFQPPCLEVLMLERQGRGVTRPLHWKK